MKVCCLGWTGRFQAGVGTTKKPPPPPPSTKAVVGLSCATHNTASNPTFVGTYHLDRRLDRSPCFTYLAVLRTV
jgi:hypothetical protein